MSSLEDIGFHEGLREEALSPSSTLQNGDAEVIPVESTCFVTIAMMQQLETNFQRKFQTYSDQLLRAEKLIWDRAQEIESLKRELKKAKEDRKQHAEGCLDAIEKLMEEIVQVGAKVIILEERVADMETLKVNGAPVTPPPEALYIGKDVGIMSGRCPPSAIRTLEPVMSQTMEGPKSKAETVNISNTTLEKQTVATSGSSITSPQQLPLQGEIPNEGNDHGKDHSRLLFCLCGLKFRTNMALSDHIRCNTGNNLLICRPCGNGKRFVRASQLRIHLQQIHKAKFTFGRSHFHNFAVAFSTPKKVKANRKPKASSTTKLSLSAMKGSKKLDSKILPVKAQTAVAESQKGNGKGQTRSDQREISPPSDRPSEPRHCICKNQSSFGQLVTCFNEKCKFEWFHYRCVDISSQPKGKWYCPQCLPTVGQDSAVHSSPGMEP